MADRWSPLDRAIYGAEDDEEMDMILDYLDRAMADSKSTTRNRLEENQSAGVDGNESPE